MESAGQMWGKGLLASAAPCKDTWGDWSVLRLAYSCTSKAHAYEYVQYVSRWGDDGTTVPTVFTTGRLWRWDWRLRPLAVTAQMMRIQSSPIYWSAGCPKRKSGSNDDNWIPIKIMSLSIANWIRCQDSLPVFESCVFNRSIVPMCQNKTWHLCSAIVFLGFFSFDDASPIMSTNMVSVVSRCAEYRIKKTYLSIIHH